MKITVDDPRTLADAIAWTARALPNRPSVPVLAGLLLDAGAGGLTLSAFDYETSRQAHVAADVADPGRILLPGHVLAEVAKSLPNQPVEMVLSGAEVTITCGRAQFTLLTMPVDDYPKLPAAPDAVGTIDAHALRDAVAQVVVGTSADTTLPMLVGMRVETAGDRLTFAATDRYRVVARDLTWEPTSPDAAAKVMIPGRTLHDITKSLPAGPVTVGLSDQMAAFWGGGRTTTVRLLDPQFVDYRAMLPLDTWGIWADVEVAPFIAAIKRITIVGERISPVRLTFSDGGVLVQAGGGDLGRGSEVVDAELDGEEIEIAFQPNYLLDGLAGVEGGRARIGMNAPAKPALIVPADGEDDPAYRYLVMALRTS